MSLSYRRIRSCRALQTAAFDKVEARQRLSACESPERGDFRLLESADWPAHETRFDVARDARQLHVTVMLNRAAAAGRATPETAEAVEVLFDPFHDHVGFVQYGADTLGGTYENSHWPYRDFVKNRHRDAPWHVELETQRPHEAPDCVTFVFFRFELAMFHGRDEVGFNVCRWQGDTQEASSWNIVSGIGFPDPGCLGHLLLTGAAVQAPSEGAATAPVRRKVHLHGTYDWPDHVWNVPYSPADLEREMRWYRDHGLERVYWLDYDSYALQVSAAGGYLDPSSDRARQLRKSIELFGTADFLPQAARAARSAGLEFITLFKPFDLLLGDAFLASHPECTMRRNPAWTTSPQCPIKTIRIYQHDDSPLPFRPESVTVWGGTDRKSMRQAGGPVLIRETVVERPEYLWSPAGKVAGLVTRPVRCLEINGLALQGPWLAVEFSACDPSVPLRNRQYLLAELVDSAGREVFWRLCAHQGAGGDPAWWQSRSWPPHDASWARLDGGMDRLLTVRASRLALEFSLEAPLHHTTILEPTFPEVRRYWLTKMQRGIDAGADGIGVRVAHHIGCDDWLAYAFAQPVMDEFRRLRGRDPEPTNEDYALVRRLRGEGFTAFLRETRALAAAAGRTVSLHVENRMLVPPELDCYCQIHWDWHTWLEEKLADEIDLKYLGPNHPAAYGEIAPLARRQGIKVNWISADLDPRTKPRSIREAALLVERTAEAGFDAMNLYELWLYRVMGREGYPLSRGCTEAILHELRKRIDEVNG